MSPREKRTRSVEFGDFQTPRELADLVCRFLVERGVEPSTVVEPTCGLGHFVQAALDRFPSADCLGFEINPAYVESLRQTLDAQADGKGRVALGSFFELDWESILGELAEPILILGNPPWVTNSGLGAFGGTNLPPKANRQGLSGLDARTGKSNFDISEWILIRLMELMAGRPGWLAMLCKTAVARRVLRHAWTHGLSIDRAEIRNIDAQTWFGAMVDACLFVCRFPPIEEGAGKLCGVFADIEQATPRQMLGEIDGQFVADVGAYQRWKHLAGPSVQRWRSGIKHDCSRVMELRRDGSGFRNGLGERVELEPEFVHPMLKSSELAAGRVEAPTRWMLVPQRAVGDDTGRLQTIAPRTWRYLLDHEEALDRRGSSIYRNRSRFSVFGVGPYSFSPWKVAISGFYKKLDFVVVGPIEGKPVVFDDTIAFIPCQSEPEARRIASMLNSEVAREFFSAFLFWDSKRPITVELLQRLNIRALAAELGR